MFPYKPFLQNLSTRFWPIILALLLAPTLLFARSPQQKKGANVTVPASSNQPLSVSSNSVGMELVYIPAGSFGYMGGTCSSCEGRGMTSDGSELIRKRIRCSQCSGKGEKICNNGWGRPHKDDRYSNGQQMVCTSCNGTGRVKCWNCGGEGEVFDAGKTIYQNEKRCQSCNGNGRLQSFPTTITKGFYIQSTEVTQKQWKAVMGSNPSQYLGDDLPVDSINWDMAKAFCNKLSKIEGRKYRLPFDAEWEYACRAGTSTHFSFGEKVSRDDAAIGNCTDGPFSFDFNNYHRKGPSPVKTFKPNGWGLYDMHGNVWEWCEDGPPSSSASYKPLAINPKGSVTGGKAWRRGGNWKNSAGNAVSHGHGYTMEKSAKTSENLMSKTWGFRVVREE